MRGIAILLLIVVFFWVVGPSIYKWLKRRAMMKAEDYIRSSMGMPPREKNRKSHKASSAESTQSTYNRSSRTGSRRYGYGRREPLIPKEYAEDVEFVETIDYSETISTTQKSGKEEHYHESQVSDVEWTEIKTSRNK